MYQNMEISMDKKWSDFEKTYQWPESEVAPDQEKF